MTSDKYQKLFNLLYDKTEVGNVAWAETIDKGTYIVSFASHSIEISLDRQETFADEPIVILRIRNSNGDLVEEISDTRAGHDIVDDNARKEFYRRSEALYQMARRTALGADKALDAIIEELDELLPF